MEPTGYDAFWSYTHEDNDRSGNRVLELAVALKNEYALCSGDELGVFIDRKSILWGEAWRERIDEAVGDVPFFIPIITPKFVKSPECRREFVAFSSAAKSRGLGKLLLPILYIPISGLAEDSDDELLALIARTQYVDWTDLRLKSPDDPLVLQGVNALAMRLIDLQQSAGAVARFEENKSIEESNVDLADTIDEIARLIAPWMESVEFDKVAGLHWAATLKERLARVDRLRASRAAQSAIFSTFVQLGKELLPIASDRLEKAKNYSRLTIELDPFVNTAIRLVSLHREESPELDVLRDGVNEAYLNMAPPETASRGFGQIDESIASLNKHLREANELLGESYKFSNEGNEIVLRWREKLIELDGPPVIPLHR